MFRPDTCPSTRLGNGAKLIRYYASEALIAHTKTCERGCRPQCRLYRRYQQILSQYTGNVRALHVASYSLFWQASPHPSYKTSRGTSGRNPAHPTSSVLKLLKPYDQANELIL